jgi:flagellar biosynthesis/type III secretory pathway chaperone
VNPRQTIPWNPRPLDDAATQPDMTRRVDALRAYLAALQAALTQLVALADEKLAAIRTGDAAGLTRCAEREAAMLEQVLLDQRRRDALLARLAQALQRPDLAGAALSEICRHLPEPQASVLTARGAALRELATQLQQKNRIVAEVARNLQAHIRGIFSDVAEAAQECVAYGARGQHEGHSRRYWVDAVG